MTCLFLINVLHSPKMVLTLLLHQVRKLEGYIANYWYKKGHRPIKHQLLPDVRRIVKFDPCEDSVSPLT
jgi:hypothetical protein